MRPVNLLPANRRAQEGGNRPGIAYVALGVLGTLLVMVVVYVLTANGLTSKQDELARVEAETQTAQQQAAALGDFGSFAQIKATREQSISQLAQARLDWERLVRELARVLPEDVYVSSMEAGAGGAAGADPAAAAPAAGGPSLKLAGCAPSNPDVATLMVRLRKLHRADDVALETSSKSEGEGGTCGRGYGFAINVTFEPAPPEQAPERVPAHLGGGA